MFRKPHLLSRRLVLVAALALGAPSVALADDGTNPSTEFSKHRTMSAQAAEPVDVQRKRVAQESEPEARPTKAKTPATSLGYRSPWMPTWYNQFPGQ